MGLDQLKQPAINNQDRARLLRRRLRMLHGSPEIGQDDRANRISSSHLLKSQGLEFPRSTRMNRLANSDDIDSVDSGDANDDDPIVFNEGVPSSSLAPSKKPSLANAPGGQDAYDLRPIRKLDIQSLNQSRTINLSSMDRDQFMLTEGPREAESSSLVSSTTALLILFICYIIWQCFRGQSQDRKCLDEWPTLLTPSRRKPRRQQSDEGCEMQAIGTLRGANSAEADNKANNSAILKVKNDNSSEPNVEIIQMNSISSNCNAISSGQKLSTKTTGFRESIMKNSLVVAANRAAKPRVELLSGKVRKFIDIGANSESQPSVSERLARILRSRGLLRKEGQDDVRDNMEEVKEQQPTVETGQTVQQNGKSDPDPIEVVLNQNMGSSLSGESSAGLSGGFIEPDMESPCAGSQSAQQIPQTNLIEPKSQTVFSSDLLGPCGCSLARSKSQTSQPYCQAQRMNQLLTTSPANIRPCCSVSPSAMARHNNSPVAHHIPDCQHHPQLNTHHHQHCYEGQFQHGGLCLTRQLMNHGGSCVNACCRGTRLKHHYENYYDDEQEDAYRRLTASIGAQFGLAIDQQNPLLPGASAAAATCSVSCKCNSAPIRQSMIMDCPLGPNGNADMSLGDSDSGNFSHANKQRVNSDSICNDSNCSLCQSSLFTAPSQQTINMFATQSGLDPIVNPQAPLVSRWNNRRRSTLYVRQPRRMSIAGVAYQQPIVIPYGSVNPQNYLHRASIASDGAVGFHHHYHHHHQPNARRIHQPSQFCSTKKSNYSSSAGSSSGIGFSGSQCLNTPTTGAFPYQSFATARPPSDLLMDDKTILSAQATSVNEHQTTWRVSTQTNQLLTQCLQFDPSSCTTNRKFSLPVHLESKAAGQLPPTNQTNDLTYKPQIDDSMTKQLPNLFKVAAPLDADQANEQCKVSITDQRPDEQTRRSSQTITRQSSFWLEDTSLEARLTQDPRLDVPKLSEEATYGKQYGRDTLELSDTKQEEPLISSSASPQFPEGPDNGGLGTNSSTARGSRYKAQHSSSSSTSSPSPDFLNRQKQRLRNRSTQSSSITKRRPLGSLKQQRRHHRQSGSHHGHRRFGSQNAELAQNQKQDTSSTDDEPDKTIHDDSLSSFDREVAKAVSGRTIPDISSTSLERQCRDLWKLRATLHDDALVGDNWSNYHQRLNRRYDSGYKSIENQFSSSIEGNVPNPLSLGLNQVPVSAGGESNLREPGRPQSGCSGMIQNQNVENGNNIVSSILNEEETQALLDNCDDHQDEQ